MLLLVALLCSSKACDLCNFSKFKYKFIIDNALSQRLDAIECGKKITLYDVNNP